MLKAKGKSCTNKFSANILSMPTCVPLRTRSVLIARLEKEIGAQFQLNKFKSLLPVIASP